MTVASPIAKKIEKSPQYIETRARPLTNIIKCGVCGGNKSIANMRRYVCASYRFGRTCSNARGIKEEKIQEEIFYYLFKAIENRQFYNIIKKKHCNNMKKIEADSQLLKDYHIRKNSLIEAYAEGEINFNTLEATKAIDNKIEALCIKKFDNLEELPSYDDVKKDFTTSFNLMKSAFNDENMLENIRATICIIVDKAVLAPIPNKSAGETIEVFLNNRWYDLYVKIKNTWI